MATSPAKAETAPVTKDVTVERLLSIVQTHDGGIRQLDLVMDRMKENLQGRVATLNNNKIESMARALFDDDSETGKAMKAVLLRLKKNGEIVTEISPFDVYGLYPLTEVGLANQYVDPTSLWADVDTYETDPLYYRLTELGSSVANRVIGLEEERNKLKR